MTTNTTTNQLEAVDDLLSRFMKSEIPNPFPKAPNPIRETTIITPVASLESRTVPGTSAASSRMSLAASVALILGGCWLLSGMMGTSNPSRNGTNLEGSNASTKPMHELLKDKEKTNKRMP